MLEYIMKIKAITKRAKWALDTINEDLKSELLSQVETDGISIKKFAKKMNINDSYIYQWVRGNVQLKEFSTLWKVAKVLQAKITFS